MSFDVQTRSEVTGLQRVATFTEALAMATADHTIWKISFVLETGEYIRLVRAAVPEGRPPLFFYESVTSVANDEIEHIARFYRKGPL